MRVAIVGTRGIPARYGGFETFAEQLSKRLVEAGHDVTVFGRSKFFSKWKVEPIDGVERVNAWTVFSKHVETPLAALTSFLYLLVHRNVDVILLCNAANSIFAFLPRLVGIPVVINVDGIERKRAKWGLLGRLWYRLGEFFSVLFGNKVIADAYSISDYYAETFGEPSAIIAYGADAEDVSEHGVFSEFEITPGKYLLYVSRMEPENNALGVVRAYNAAKIEMPLVVVGDAPYASEYRAKLHAEAGAGVIFTGYQFGDAYQALQSNCYLYIQATEVGGTHPALIESMAHGNCIVANGVPEHFEVLGGAGVYYEKNDFEELARLLSALSRNEGLVSAHRELAGARAGQRYTWDSVTTKYQALFSELR